MTAAYTFDVFSSLDGFGAASGNWTGYWGKPGPDLLARRLALYDVEQRMIFGANTYRAFAHMLASSTEESEVRDPWVARMRNLPATVVSTTLEGPLDWPDATVVSGDAAEVVARLKEESEVPLRSHGSLSMNRALMAAGLVSRPRSRDALPCDHRSERDGPDLPGCGRLRPRAGRESDARWSHSRAHLPTHHPLTCGDSKWIRRGTGRHPGAGAWKLAAIRTELLPWEPLARRQMKVRARCLCPARGGKTRLARPSLERADRGSCVRWAGLLNEQTEWMPGRVGQHVQRFALVLGTVVQHPRAQLLGVRAMPLKLLHRWDLEVHMNRVRLRWSDAAASGS